MKKKSVVSRLTVSLCPDRHTQALLTGAYTRAKEDPNLVINWKTPTGFVSLDAEAIITIADAVFAHVENAFTEEKNKIESVSSVNSIIDLINDNY